MLNMAMKSHRLVCLSEAFKGQGKTMPALLFLWILFSLAVAGTALADGDYSGDERCPAPTDWSKYSEPYFPSQHPHEYPTFHKADWPGWCCSYQREDGVVVQYGDCRTPQEQWLSVFGGGNGESN